MPTNANTFNSRVTSEALEAKFRQVFPAQGGAELVQDLFASGVIQPVVDFSTVAEGSVLAPDLQTAWDFSTGTQTVSTATTVTIISNPGFWKLNLIAAFQMNNDTLSASISDGLSTKQIWKVSTPSIGAVVAAEDNQDFVVFLRAGDSVSISSNSSNAKLSAFWRQIADVNGNLVNPLGFTFS